METSDLFHTKQLLLHKIIQIDQIWIPGKCGI